MQIVFGCCFFSFECSMSLSLPTVKTEREEIMLGMCINRDDNNIMGDQ